MDLFRFGDEEIAAVKNEFPKLELIKAGTWEGSFDFEATHKEYTILGAAEVQIVASADYPQRIPVVHDIGGRVKEIARLRGISDLRKLHINERGGALCLCVRQEEPKKFPPGSNLVDFIRELVIPYYYGVEYYNEYGQWPWREYGHYGLGTLEYYAEDPSKQTKMTIIRLASFLYDDQNLKKYRRYVLNSLGAKCVCGSDLSFESCHSLAWAGLMRFANDAAELHLNPKKLLAMVDKRGRRKKRY